MSPKNIERATRAFRWIEIASLIVGLAALAATLGIKYAGWQPGFSATGAGALSLFCAGLHFIARIDTGAPRARRHPNA